MTVSGILVAIRGFAAANLRTLVLTLVCALAVASSSTIVAAAKITDDERIAAEQAAAAATAAALEAKYVEYYTGALERLQVIGLQLTDDTSAWAASGSALLTASDVAALKDIADALGTSIARAPAADADGAALEKLWSSQLSMIEGARERLRYIVGLVVTAAAAHLAAAPIADAGSRTAVADAITALQKADRDRLPLTEPLATLSAAVTAVDASQAAAVAAAAAAAAAAKKSGVTIRPGSPAASGAPEPTCSSDVLTCTNQLRAHYGIAPLAASGGLNSTAQSCANVLAQPGAPFQHTLPLAPGVRGENIARGFPNQISVFNGWKNSPGHKANLLRTSFTQMGLGLANGEGGNNWCQHFS